MHRSLEVYDEVYMILAACRCRSPTGLGTTFDPQRGAQVGACTQRTVHMCVVHQGDGSLIVVAYVREMRSWTPRSVRAKPSHALTDLLHKAQVAHLSTNTTLGVQSENPGVNMIAFLLHSIHRHGVQEVNCSIHHQ